MKQVFFKEIIGCILSVFSLLYITACNSPAGSRAVGDSSHVRKPRHQVVLHPNKQDPLAERAAVGDSAVTTRLTASEQKNGWKLLFDGKDLAGWKGFNADTIGKAWKVSDGILHLDFSDRDNWKANHGGDLCTEKEYGNFDLSLEYRTYEYSNSGVLIRVQEGPGWKNPFDSGVEMQILDDSSNPDKTVANHRSGSMFDIFAAPSTLAANRPGTWNHLVIKARNNSITYLLNGKRAVQVAIGSKVWKDSLSKSKFSKQHGFATAGKGKIDLQEHGGSVDYKNIKIRSV